MLIFYNNFTQIVKFNLDKTGSFWQKINDKQLKVKFH